MIEKNYTNTGCFTEEELVSYLYGESGETDRAIFEQHLSGCSACTDEFANLSDSRFSVYQWQKVDFARLPTPMITGPWQEPAVHTHESGSWFEGLVAAFRRPAFALGAVSFLIIAGLAMGVYFMSTQRSNDGVAGNIQLPVVEIPSEPSAREVATLPDTTPQNEEKRVAAKETETRKPTVTYAKVVKAPSARRMIGSEVASTNVTPRDSATNRRAPRLSDFEEEDDSSIRLADLLAETDRDKDR